MSGDPRPWWASDGPVDGGVAPDEDPLERSRSSRRREAPRADDEAREPAWLGAAVGAVSQLADELAATAEAQGAPPAADERPDAGRAEPHDGAREHRVEACGACPVCAGLRTLAETRPELVGHLAEAARHVALAARSLVERPEQADEPLERIDLD